MKNEFKATPIAYIRNDFKEKFGIPRQSGRAPSLTAEIVFEPAYRRPDALRGIEGFSHLWLLFDFSEAHRKEWSATVRPPRLGGNTRVGVFASRSPFRPNPIGLSCVRLLRVEKRENEGDVLIVSGADLLDGTPILDIKPYLPFADCKTDATGGYADEHEHHALQVVFPQDLLARVAEEKRLGLQECLADDPRPSYQDDPDRIYGMRFGIYEIKFRVVGEILTVLNVDIS
ncbi:MAG: tRNA (N6-threonylcarbamoyladenosine(37)-N6)-methyltransferase TrmO [Clostridia bacterium]|nr:tRNA (N6-threonylcarbamoyladenosine(37)-N6)-methyltransferase TrmO [Clostridia bacterium]